MNERDPVLEYQSGLPTSRAAWAVFGLALAAAVGFFLVVPSLVVFIAALIVRQIVPPRDVKGLSLATVAIRVSFYSAALGLLCFILIPSFGRTHVVGGRSVCSANLRGIMQSMLVYASDNNDAFPTVPFAPYAAVPNAATGTSTGATHAEAANRQYYSPPYPQAGTVQACLWLLVLGGQVAPRQFLCKTDPFGDSSAVAMNDQAGNWFNNFPTPKQLSYSAAYPWNADGKPGAWWKNTQDVSLPLIADMTPLQGTGTPARNLVPARAPADNKTWNSANHCGDGQNVGFADGHAEFCRTPAVGQNDDNIYALSADPSTGPAQFGGIPAGAAAPALTAEKAPFDIILLPVRNETTGAM